MITFLTVVHISTVVILVIAVLLQSGKGAEISATFGGSSQTVFGSSGGVNFFQKLTYGLAFVFMCTSLALTLLPQRMKTSVFEGYTPPPASAPAETVPATTGAATTTTSSTATTTETTTKAVAPTDAKAPAAAPKTEPKK
jgi:preprotein translocase subunit SecG